LSAVALSWSSIGLEGGRAVGHLYAMIKNGLDEDDQKKYPTSAQSSDRIQLRWLKSIIGWLVLHKQHRSVALYAINIL
jgi:hypothetical protein